jgi:hypothetical protein
LIEGCCRQGPYISKGSWWISCSHHLESFTVASMTCPTATEYLRHKWPRVCSVCRNHNPVFSSPGL